jgi:RNA polymerase sigma-70 factor (ECF subfamily)
MSSNAASLTELLIRERPALLRRVQRILGATTAPRT